MTTLTTNVRLSNDLASEAQHLSLWNKWLTLADSQAPRKTLWFMISLISQGVLFLPMPALLIYYFNAPVFVLGITLVLFFINFIAGMGGSNIRTTLTLFAISIMAHLIMLLIFLL
ncbi:hypothetical protein BEL04_06280 [Mucilaginibacter sp. PPCGB 2223]|uniref:hypothetical protein n=1 Tax=Mucilaginibacter sp. PPCGB 2223 TaxID=1886027 RepID=UPI00082521B8|nr:hypothetical protein [Mucilaginibacter sp. PPCGB 2223]OCX53890.1 hypothetical protein BEL04_06280 [Mucilaginibacter sp. PPCGB 2223]